MRVTDQLAEPGVVVDDAPNAAPQRGSVPSARRPPRKTAQPGWWEQRRQQRRTRLSKWDRPPDPYDWRYLVGHLGRIMIAAGLLLFGFVAYQLWGTGIETARAQDRLEDQFEAIMAGAEAANADLADTDDQPGFAPVPERPVVVADDGEVVEEQPVLEASDPAIAEVVPAESQELPPVVPGQAIMRVEIPSIGVNNMVLPGVTRNDLKEGPGHFPDSPMPGQLGNAALAGHRTTYGAPFNELDELVPGDRIVVTRIDGNQYTYAVTDTIIVNPEDYWVVTTTDPSRATLTLTTCHPETTAKQRMAVFSELIPEESGPVGEATFYEGFRDPNAQLPSPDDDPTFVQPEAALPTTDSTVVVSATTEPAQTASTVAEPVDELATVDPVEVTNEPAIAPGVVLDEPSEHVEAAFSEGWFDDDQAWPQIALWGSVLTLIALVAYSISRRFRRDSFGFLVGILPFVVAMYFFYQNVNRLLPAGL